MGKGIIYEAFAEMLCRPSGAWPVWGRIPRLAPWAKFCRPVRGWGWEALVRGAQAAQEGVGRYRKVSQGIGR
ncbi:MAG: hypothetical protein JWR19_2656 [Pedosphaera sp.]|nr:hypothetical protein [Pedosphaera sp.]